MEGKGSKMVNYEQGYFNRDYRRDTWEYAEGTLNRWTVTRKLTQDGKV